MESRKPDMNRRYVEVCVSPAVEGGEILARLDEFSPLGAWEEDSTLHLYWPAASWNSRALRALREAIAALGADPGCTRIRIESLDDRDWTSDWERSTRPIRIGRRILIRQSWNSVEAKESDIVLLLDPKRAFGTGYHATTQLMIEMLEDWIRGGETVVDVGTGSGILAMIALRLGAASALGIDHDADAIALAREYAKLNGFKSGLRFRRGHLEGLRRMDMDLVLANLDRNTLLRLPGKLVRLMHEGGSMLVTGILTEDEADICDAFSREGVHVLDRRAREDWLLLRMGRQK